MVVLVCLSRVVEDREEVAVDSHCVLPALGAATGWIGASFGPWSRRHFVFRGGRAAVALDIRRQHFVNNEAQFLLVSKRMAHIGRAEANRAKSRARKYREASYGDDITRSYEVVDSLEKLERDIHGETSQIFQLPGRAPASFGPSEVVVEKSHFLSRTIARQREAMDVETKHRETAEKGWLKEQRARAMAQGQLSKSMEKCHQLSDKIDDQQKAVSDYQLQMLKEKKKRLRADAKYEDIEQQYFRKCAKLKRVIERHRDYVERQRMNAIKRRKREWCGLTGRLVEKLQTCPCCCIAFICYDKAPFWADMFVMVCGDYDGKGQCMAVDDRDTSGCIGQCCRMCRYEPGVKASQVYRKLYPPKDMIDDGENVKYASQRFRRTPFF